MICSGLPMVVVMLLAFEVRVKVIRGRAIN
jgi:hypothetical protein